MVAAGYGRRDHRHRRIEHHRWSIEGSVAAIAASTRETIADNWSGRSIANVPTNVLATAIVKLHNGPVTAGAMYSGTVKLSTFDGSGGSKVGGNPRLRAITSPQAQHLGR